MFKLTNKAVVITGAGSGIGTAIAECFAQAGAKLYLMDTNADAGNAVAGRIREQGGKAEFLEGDVRDEASCQAVAAAVHVANDNRCDILVNNAGIGHVGTILTTTAEDLDRIYEVNVKGVLLMTRAFLPSMIERKSGSIVNLASIGGLVGIRDRLAYCASKFAVVGITKAAALDHADSQVRFNCICPGRVETPFMRARISEYPDPEKAYHEMAATQALGRMGNPEEIAAAALYLASDEAAFVTGSSLIIDGGWSAGK
jgi:2-keto-3-deoxy-L-fuconate dehydrogenase